LEGKLMVAPYDLKLVWQFMSAYLINFEQVDHVGVLTNMELPYTVKLTTETYDQNNLFTIGLNMYLQWTGWSALTNIVFSEMLLIKNIVAI